MGLSLPPAKVDGKALLLKYHRSGESIVNAQLSCEAKRRGLRLTGPKRDVGAENPIDFTHASAYLFAGKQSITRTTAESFATRRGQSACAKIRFAIQLYAAENERRGLGYAPLRARVRFSIKRNQNGFASISR
jgi:hypothetical protein